MYRTGKEYDQMAQLAISIYCDYQLKEFPIDAKRLCERMGVQLIPYSMLSEIDRAILLSKSDYGFYVPILKGRPPRIFYNDDSSMVGSEDRIRFYLLHELKHYANEDSEADNKDDLADYFARYMACPIPLLIVQNIDAPSSICAAFGVGYSVAENVASNVRNRKQKYGSAIFDYEKILVRQFINGNEFIEN